MAPHSRSQASALAERVRAAQLPPPAECARIRRASRATLRDIAQVLGVSPMTVHRWETGIVEPRLGHAVAYRRLLDDIQEASVRPEESVSR